MKIIHTSDWHLGKRLIDRERLPEQEEALNALIGIAEREQADLVLVAGDVFDTYLPPSEAEELFYRAAKRLSEGRALVVIAGNHDDATRLAAAASLAQDHNIFIAGNRPHAFPLGKRGKIEVKESGDFYLVLANEAGESVYLNLLPYPNEARFREERTEESFPERVARWIARGDEGYRGDMPHILVSHLFVAGGKTSESERDIDLGGARAVPVRVLPDFGYVALGHLHRRQAVGANIRYSGSLLQYSFDETNTEKSVVLLETQGNEVRFSKEIPLNAGKKLLRLECDGVGNALDVLSRYENSYIELTLHLKAPLTTQETHALGEANEGLVSIVARLETEDREELAERSNLSPEELFLEYYRSQYGEDPSAELKEAYLSILEDEA